MKTMYKGVFTVVAATLVASVAIIATNANTKDATGDEEKQDTVSTTATNVKAVVVEKTEDSAVSTAVKGASTGVVVAVDKVTDTKKDEATNVSSEVKTAETVNANGDHKDASYPAPPPGPFTEKKEGVAESAQDITGKPVAPTKPVVAMEAPQAPVAPTVAANADTVESDTVKKELEAAGIKAPAAPKADITAPVKPAVDASVPDASQSTVKTEVVAPMPEAPVKGGELEILKAVKSVTTTVESKVKAAVIDPVKAVADAVLEPVKAVVAPVMGLSAPAMPKIIDLKAPVAPAKPETSALKAPEAPKPSGMPKVVPMMAPQGFMMPQGMRPQGMMMPPQGVMMPQGMPPQGMMPSQMINGQRMMMVPVYPMNMGRPAYPYGYQMPFPNMMPQGAVNPGQAMKPNPQPSQPQQAPAEKTEK